MIYCRHPGVTGDWGKNMQHEPIEQDVADLVRKLDPEQIRIVMAYIKQLQSEDVE